MMGKKNIHLLGNRFPFYNSLLQLLVFSLFPLTMWRRKKLFDYIFNYTFFSFFNQWKKIIFHTLTTCLRWDFMLFNFFSTQIDIRRSVYQDWVWMTSKEKNHIFFLLLFFFIPQWLVNFFSYFIILIIASFFVFYWTDIMQQQLFGGKMFRFLYSAAILSLIYFSDEYLSLLFNM